MKKKTVRVILIIAGVLAGGIGLLLFRGHLMRQQESFLALTDAQKASDYQYLCDVMEEIYPFWYELGQKGIDRDAVMADYAERTQKAGTDVRFYERLSRFAAAFDNMGHFSVLSGEMFALHRDTFRENPAVAGPWMEVLENDKTEAFYTGLIAFENASDEDKDTVEDTKDASIEAREGSVKDADESVSEDIANAVISEQPNRSPLSAVETKLLNANTAYLKIPDFLLQSIGTDTNVIFDFYDEIANTENLIIDIRGNSGGSDNYWKGLIVAPNIKQDLSHKNYALFSQNELLRPFLEADFSPAEIKPIADLPDFPNQTYDYKTVFSHYVEVEETYTAAANPYPGSIWLLVDEKVYSAAENLAIFCKDTGFATLVGQPTGGDGGLASNPLLFSLPESGIVCRFSYLYRLNSDGSSNELTGTTPDITVAAEKDSLEVCLDEINSEREGNRKDAHTKIPGQILEENNYYKIIFTEKDGYREYQYIIYNKQKKAVKEEHHGHEPIISYIDENTLEIILSAGADTHFYQYYDIEADRFSEVYTNAVIAQYGKVAYLDHGRDPCVLAVSDLYDKNKFYKEFLLDFSKAVAPITDAVFIDENTLKVVYMAGDSYDTKSAVLNL